MTFKELMIDIISNTSLFEQAFDKKTAENKIRGLADPLLLHLIKIIKWEDKSNYKKHLDDIDIWLDDILRAKLKPRNNRFKSHQYFELIYNEPIGNDLEIIDIIINRRLKKYHNLKVLVYDNENVMTILKNIITLISKDLSNNKLKDIEEYLTLTYAS